jgi:fructokinase
MFGGVELGGTKVVVAVGTGPRNVVDHQRAPTTTPDETMAWIVDRLADFDRRFGPLAAVGIATFGPVDLRPGPTLGRLLNTPKLAWIGADVHDPVRAAFDVPIGLGSDVEGAALAEGAAGAARRLDHFVYVTVGTGVGMGVVVGGRLVRGMLHPELGHMTVRRQPGDDFAGTCPFHGDCLEGMASGPAMGARWGRPAETIEGAPRRKALALEAAYLADGLATVVYAYAPQRIVVGGGVGLTPGLLPGVRKALRAKLAGYPGVPELDSPRMVVAAGLRDLAGPVGALAFAADAYGSVTSPPPGGC